MSATEYEPTHLDRWTMPSHYMGAVWPNYYSAGVGQSRDSSALERANFDEVVARLEALPDLADDDPGWEVVKENHWAVGWVEWIAIHQDATTHLKLADAIADALEDYPVVCESRLSEYETEEAEVVWKNCYSIAERIAYIRDRRSQFEPRTLADLLACVRGQYFLGYASELIA